ncbi:MAG: cell surface receptor domain protein [Frankiales bacterium]|nr:cell surface receptor domain protein [Frankiales bacterium]
MSTHPTFRRRHAEQPFPYVPATASRHSGKRPLRVLITAGLGVSALALSLFWGTGTASAQTAAADTGSTQSATFNNVGGSQQFVVPTGVTTLSFSVSGGGGGNGAGTSDPGGSGGSGGLVTGNLPVTGGEALVLCVGPRGGDASSGYFSQTLGAGGLSGCSAKGGTGGSENDAPLITDSGTGGGGGAASSIFDPAADSLLVVAGGGGGGGGGFTSNPDTYGGNGGFGGNPAGGGDDGYNGSIGNVLRTYGYGGGGGTNSASYGGNGTDANPDPFVNNEYLAGGGGGGGGYNGGTAGGGYGGTQDSGGGGGQSWSGPTVTGVVQSHTTTSTDGQITLSWTPAPATARLASNSIGYENQLVGVTAPAGYVAITNTGSVPLTITGLAAGGANPGDFSGTFGSCSGSLAPGYACELGATFTPTAAGPRSATLLVLDSAADSPQVITLSGLGLAPATATLSSNSLAFGNQRVGTTSQTRSVSLTNNGDVPLVFDGVGVFGANPGDYTGNAGTCGATIAAHSSCQLNASFAPTTAGDRGAALLVYYEGPTSPQGVSLVGTGVTATAPTAPSGFTATAGNTQVALRWTAPSSDGGSPITGYDVFEATTSGSEKTVPVNASPLSPTASAYTATGLTNAKQYYFTVRAINSVGSSPASKEVSAVPVLPLIAPTVNMITPTSGPTGGGTTVTITGTGFTGAKKVTFGGVSATSFTVVSSTKITAISPAQGAGDHPVYVNTAGGTSAASAAATFSYVKAPVVTAISPTSGPTAGGTKVTITGTNFTKATSVKFGTVAARSFTVVSSTRISAVSPAQGASVRNVLVATAGGISGAVTADRYTYH